MEKEKFRNHLNEATVAVLKLTTKFCYNTLSEDTEYIIVPNSRDKSEHLDQLENDVLDRWNEKKAKKLTSEEVVNLLCHENRVPLWIDILVLESAKNLTIVELLCSRRLRKEAELMYHDKIPPFNIGVALPSWYKQNCKFDINWRVKSKMYLKFSYLLDKFKRFFR